MITWADRLHNLNNALGRKPTFAELLEIARIHQMTPDEIDAQRASFVRGMRCEHGELDFEQCKECRKKIT